MDKSMISSDFNIPLESSLPEFVKPIDDKHLCAKCCQLLRPPVKQSMCGHRMCSKCVDEMFDGVTEAECPGQEEDCIPLRKDELNPDRACNRELQRLEVYCTNNRHGCQLKVKWSKLNEHIKTCPFRTVQCTNINCNEMILEKDLEKHLSECDFTLEHCSVCGNDIPRLQMRSGHVNECMVNPRKCILEPYGCTFEAPSNAHEAHLVSCVVIHGKHMIKSVQKYITDQEEMKQEMKHKIRKQEQQIGILQKTMDSLTVDSNQDTILALKQIIDNLRSAMDDVVKKADESETRIANNFVVKVLPVVGDNLVAIKVCADGQLSERVRRLETTNGIHDVRFAEADLRFRLLETAAFNGKLIWRIPNYSRRKRDAIEGRKVSLDSQPFYTSTNGYKMCARIYLNGDGLGKGSHLSLYFVMMRGEYDSFLTWPFRQRVTLALLDQNGNKKHITDTFLPDPTSLSFRRPVGEMNIASGSPTFARHDLVEFEPYLKDDSIFIRISVDTSDMQDPFA